MKWELEVHKKISYCNSELGKEKGKGLKEVVGVGGVITGTIIRVNEFGRDGEI